MIIDYKDIPIETLRTIIKENIIRGNDDFCCNIENEIESTIKKIRKGDIKIVYSQSKNDVTLVNKDLF